MTQSTERKLTTILSADAVGYSRLMGKDETGTFATLKAYRDVTIDRITAHRGRVVNTAGDSILAEFPSVVKAVECAVEIQRTIAERNGALAKDRQMWFRIGINLGDVMVDNNDLFGDGVNVAARLQALADPGGILISGTVFDHVKDKLAVSFDALGVRAIKNISTQVPVYRVVLEYGRVEASQPDQLAASVETPYAPKQALMTRFYPNAAIAGALVVFLFGVNMFTADEWWFQWPTLIIALVLAFRTISLFGRPDLPGTAFETSDALKEARLHRFYVNTAIAGTLIAFLFSINMFTNSPFWFQWPALPILLVYALRTIFLFRKRIV